MMALCLLATSFFYVNDSVVTMREEPAHEARVTSQAIYSEKVIPEKKQGSWVYIKTSDGYLGWVPEGSILQRETPYDSDICISRLKAHVYGVKDTEWGPVKSLPYGAKLLSIDSTDDRWIEVRLLDDSTAYIQKGDVLAEPILLKKEDLVEFSKKFLGLPYTWGGRSSFGYDCSGFVQMLYSKIGIDLQRDSKQQILDNRFRTISVNEFETGDLVFFGKSDHQISHVGMCIGNGQFIHSCPRENQPWIRISNLSDPEWKGIGSGRYPYRSMRQLLVKTNYGRQQ